MLRIKIFGSGCPNCIKLEQMCQEVVNELSLNATIEKVTDLDEIINHGVMLTPALMVNDKLLVQGKLPTKATLVNWLKKRE